MIYELIDKDGKIKGGVDTKRIIGFIYDGTSSDYDHRYILKLEGRHTLTVDASDMQNILSAMKTESTIEQKSGKWLNLPGDDIEEGSME